MRSEDFRRPTTPGRLEPTRFLERRFGQKGPEVHPVVGVGYVPDDLPAGVTKTGIAAGIQDNLLAAEGNLCLLEGRARNILNPGMLIGAFAHKEAVHSSAIENTFASEKQLVLFDADPTAVEPSRQPEVREVNNYLRALRHGFDAREPVCLRLMREMHAILMEGVTRTAGVPGQFRKAQNAIGNPSAPFKDAKFVPPPPEFVDPCLNRLEAFIHARDDLPLLVRIALVHYQFETIHPFDDGNGRLGRLLVSLQLCKHGRLSAPLLYISGFFDRHRQDYTELLYRVSSEGCWTEWINFFLSAVATQARDAFLRVEKMEALRADFHARVRRKRASGMLPKIVDSLFDRPAFTVAQVAKLTGMGAASANRLVRQLEESGIITEATGRKHSRVFMAEPVLDVMTEILSHEPEPQPPAPSARA